MKYALCISFLFNTYLLYKVFKVWYGKKKSTMQVPVWVDGSGRIRLEEKTKEDVTLQDEGRYDTVEERNEFGQ
jgi:hypothetical protein